jgi:truncated hemoglobin YjbI
MSAEPARPDITGREDISRLVAEFYRRAFIDDLLGPVFVAGSISRRLRGQPATELVTIRSQPPDQWPS